MNNNPGKLDLSKANPNAPAAPESSAPPSRPGGIRITASQAEALAAGPKKRRPSILRPLISFALLVLLAVGLYATRDLWLPAAQSALALVRDRLDTPALPSPAEIPESPLDAPAPSPEAPAVPSVPSVPEVSEVPEVPSVPSTPPPAPRSPEFQAAARLFNQALADFRTFTSDPSRTDLLSAIEDRATQAAHALEALPPSAAPGENIPALVSQCYRLVSDARSRHLLAPSSSPAPESASGTSKIKTVGPRRRPALPAYTPPAP